MRYRFDEFTKYGSEEFADMAEVYHVAYSVCQIIDNRVGTWSNQGTCYN